MISLTVSADPKVGLLYSNIDIMNQIFTDGFSRSMNTIKVKTSNLSNQENTVKLAEVSAAKALKRLKMDKVDIEVFMPSEESIIVRLRLKPEYAYGLTATLQ